VISTLAGDSPFLIFTRKLKGISRDTTIGALTPERERFLHVFHLKRIWDVVVDAEENRCEGVKVRHCRIVLAWCAGPT
jgi:hypothetical protein